MSERSLNDVIRQIGVALTHLEFAEELADTLLQNHVVASDIRMIQLDLKHYAEHLNSEYRSKHFSKRR